MPPTFRAVKTKKDGEPTVNCRREVAFFADFICVFCLFFVYAGSCVPAINEPHYWTKAAHFWDFNFCKGDLFLESGDAHWLFFATFGYLTQCMPIAWAVWAGRFITWIFLAIGWTMLGRSLWFVGRMPLATQPSLAPKGTHFEPQRASVRAGKLGIACESEPHASELRLGNYNPQVPLAATCFGLVWLVGLHYGHWAGEWVVGGCESKGIAYALIFAGIASAIRRHWTLAWALLGGAAAYHVVTGIWVIACLAVVSFVIDFVNMRKFTGKSSFFQGLLGWIALHQLGWTVCLVGIIVGVVPAIAIDWGIDPVLASESAVKQVYTRLGHHLAPTRFSWIRWQDFGIQLVCACIVILMAIRSNWQLIRINGDGPANREAGITLDASSKISPEKKTACPRGMQFVVGCGLFGFAVAMFGLFIDLAFGWAFPRITSKLLRFYLFRWNDVAMPMMIGSLVVSFAYGKLTFTPSPSRARWVAWGFTLVPGLFLLAYRFEANFNETIPAGDKAHFVAKSDSESDQIKQYQDWLRVCDWIKLHADSESLWLTPRRQQSFKWRTGRPELACWKDAPQNAEALVEWSQRLSDAYQFDKTKTLQPWTTEKLWELQSKYGIRYVLLDRRVAGQITPSLPLLYPSQNEFNDTFAVFELPSQKVHVSR
ncbi:MAG TPA: DUF6798 domain-containing protein [Pirellula sp.]|nr:DUF6798 domain-containing protein [Pirellula sp.]